MNNLRNVIELSIYENFHYIKVQSSWEFFFFFIFKVIIIYYILAQKSSRTTKFDHINENKKNRKLKVKLPLGM